MKAQSFSHVITSFDIDECINEIVQLQNDEAFLRGISLVQVPVTNRSTKLKVESDKKRIQQILINLQSNALKFTKRGGDVSISCKFVPKSGSN